MKKDDDFNPDINFDDLLDDEDDEGMCPAIIEAMDMFEDVFSDTLQNNCHDNPLGISWDYDIMIDFLKRRGYKILDRNGNDQVKHKVAVKPTDPCIPEEDNIYDVFQKELQLAIIEKLTC